MFSVCFSSSGLFFACGSWEVAAVALVSSHNLSQPEAYGSGDSQ